jgi:HD-like signal output (HDOD) protein
MSAIVTAIREEVTTAISKDALQLPTLPEIALKIREAAEQDEVDVAKLAAVIGADPGLSAQLIRVANSPAFRGRSDVETVQMAITRLGLGYSCNLATGLAMKQCFQATSDVIERRMRRVWNHATQVAAISTVLARNFTRVKPDLAALAGLVHNIGVLPVLTWAEENDQLLHDGITLDRVSEALQGELGTTILAGWDFPSEIVAVPSGFNDFARERSTADITDVVMIANLQCYAGTEHPYAALDWTSIGAFARLGLDPSAQMDDLEDLSADLEAARSVFE